MVAQVREATPLCQRALMSRLPAESRLAPSDSRQGFLRWHIYGASAAVQAHPEGVLCLGQGSSDQQTSFR